MVPKRLGHNDYGIGWICALSEELTAATAMLDEKHDSLPISSPKDNNSYTLGAIGKHNVVLACLPKGEIGNNPAAGVVTQLVNTFPSIKFGLMVGIGGGIPPNVRLGDIVVSTPVGEFPGVVQWDLGKATDGGFKRTGSLDRPPKALLSALTTMKTKHEMEGHKISQFLGELATKWPRLASKYTWNDGLKDTLFEQDSTEPTNHGWQTIFATPRQTIATLLGYSLDSEDPGRIRRTNNCDTMVVDDERMPGDPKIHYGLIASGNQVIKDSSIRDEINRKLGGQILCFEMEAAGVISNFPCLVIRGISDYADSKKNDQWRGYAAAIAAAFTKELLQLIRPTEIEGEPSARDVLNHVYKSVDHIQLKVDKQEEKQILDWLTPIDYGLLHSDYYKELQPGTGEWFLEQKEFQDWITGRNNTLFCHGIPGAGKTMLVSMVINHLFSKFRRDYNIGIAFVYFNYNRQEEQDSQKLFASLLKQLAGGRHSLPESTRDLYNAHSNKRTRASLEEVIMDLNCVIKEYSEVFIILDALDECRFYDLNLYLSKLFEFQKEYGIKILATSRPIQEIMDRFNNLSIIKLHIRAETSDVTKYIEGHMDKLPKVARENPALKEEIKEDISGAVDGMFLLARMYVALLEDKMTVNEIRRQLVIFKSRNQGDTHDKKVKIPAYAYEQAIERVRSQQEGIRSLAMQALAWVTLAKRQITTSELQHALATQDGMTALSHDDLPDLTDITSACVGLLTVDEESRVIRLVHYTAHEYLEQTQSRWFPSADESILRSCLTYLLFDVFKSGFCQSDEAFEHRKECFPFFHYAANHWSHHLSQTPEHVEEVICFLESQTNVEASIQAGFTEKQHPFHLNYSQEAPRELTGLHVAALLGLTEVTRSLLERGYSPNAKASSNKDPLLLASTYSHKPRIDMRAKPGVINLKMGATPLICAIIGGHEAVVKLLLEKGGDINAHDYAGRTPLSLAALSEHKTIIELLLRDGGIIHNEDRLGKTALFISDVQLSRFHKPHQLLVKNVYNMTRNSEVRHWIEPDIGSDLDIYQLIESDTDLNAKDENSRTLLSRAAELGRRDLIQMLIETGKVDLNKADGETGMTPLHWAARAGHMCAVELLASAGADLETKEKEHHITPLGLAVKARRNNVVDLLLQKGANINKSDIQGRTPLYHAVYRGDLTIIQLLVDRGAYIHTKTYDGLTVLFAAIIRGYFDVVKLLIERGADVNAIDNDGEMASFPVAGNGDFETVKTSVERSININTGESQKGMPPLAYAVTAGHIDIMRLLVESGAKINARDEAGSTALFVAASFRNVDAISLLVQMGADVNIRNKGGRTPLHYSARYNRPASFQALIDGGADVNARDTVGRSVLFYAIFHDNIPVIELMVGMDDINFNTPDATGLLPIIFATYLQRHKIIKLLLQTGKITTNLVEIHD